MTDMNEDLNRKEQEGNPSDNRKIPPQRPQGRPGQSAPSFEQKRQEKIKNFQLNLQEQDL